MQKFATWVWAVFGMALVSSSAWALAVTEASEKSEILARLVAKGLLIDSKDAELVSIEKVADENFTTTKYEFHYRGVRVHGAMIYKSVDSTRAVNELSTVHPVAIDVNAAITPAQALSISQSYSTNPLKRPVELVILPSSDRSTYKLAYEVEFATFNSISGANVLVDAMNGSILAAGSKELHLAERSAPSPEPTALPSFNVFSAKNQGFAIVPMPKLNPQTKKPETDMQGRLIMDHCLLGDYANQKWISLTAGQCSPRGMKAMHPEVLHSCQLMTVVEPSSRYPKDLIAEPQMIEPTACRPIYANSTRVAGSPDDLSAKRAAVNTMRVLEYYRTRHGRNSIDGVGGSVTAVVHAGHLYANAAWDEDGNYMQYGDGDRSVSGTNSLSPLGRTVDDSVNMETRDFTGALDVAGHEMTHGVVAHTAHLGPFDESGALNEALADFFGIIIANGPNGVTDWTMGRRIFFERSRWGLRDVARPSVLKVEVDSRQGKTIQVPYPDTLAKKIVPSDGKCTEENDLCFVHGNSTIASHAFYNVYQAIGAERAEKIIYGAMVHFMNKGTGFREAGAAVRKACEVLYKAEPDTCKKVDAALGLGGI